MSVASSWYSKIYQPYELENFLSKVDFDLLDRVLNRCARKCGIEFYTVPTRRVKASSLYGSTAGEASYVSRYITMDVGKIISESVDRKIDPFLVFLKIFIHEQIHIGFEIRNEGVVERLSRELLIEYASESDTESVSEARKVVDSFRLDHNYNVYIANVTDCIDEVSEKYGLDPDQAWRAMVGFLSSNDSISSILSNSAPAANKVASYHRTRKVF